jgi:hypothetical protein
MRVPAKRGDSGAMAAIVLILALALMATACSLGGTDTTVAANTTAAPTTTEVSETTATTAGQTTTSVEVTTTTAGPESTVTTEELSSAETVLYDGSIRAMGRIAEVSEDGARKIKIDYVEWLTGEEARQAAIDAGELGPDEDLPNDYYIRGGDVDIREFAVSDSVAITTASRGGGEGEPATWAEFMSWFGGSPPSGTEYLRDMPWWIVREGDVIVKIDEQYVP